MTRNKGVYRYGVNRTAVFYQRLKRFDGGIIHNWLGPLMLGEVATTGTAVMWLRRSGIVEIPAAQFYRTQKILE